MSKPKRLTTIKTPAKNRWNTIGEDQYSYFMDHTQVYIWKDKIDPDFGSVNLWNFEIYSEVAEINGNSQPSKKKCKEVALRLASSCEDFTVVMEKHKENYNAESKRKKRT